MLFTAEKLLRLATANGIITGSERVAKNALSVGRLVVDNECAL